MSAGPGGETASPQDCSVCNHSGKVTQCPGCGGLIGFGKWPPCTFCQAKVGIQVLDPPPMVSTIYPSIESTEPAALPNPVKLVETSTREQFADVVRQLEALGEELRIVGEELQTITRRAKRMLA